MSRAKFRGALPLALIATFVAGVIIDGWFRTHGAPKPAPITAAGDVFLSAPSAKKTEGRLTASAKTSAVAKPGTTASTPSAPVPSVASGAPVSPKPAGEGGLRIPIDGLDIETLKGGFAERRDSGGRPHEAVDMLAPTNTPVHAVVAGSVAKLFTSKQGGLTIYQFDADAHLCYYYAHLDHYAEGLKDGQAIAAGEIIGYVGTTGNAPPGTPHLHFAVFELNADKRWWQGRPIDPYRVFKNEG